LLPLAKRGDEFDVSRAIRTLGAIGPPASEIAPVLRGNIKARQGNLFDSIRSDSARALWQVERSEEALELFLQEGYIGENPDVGALGIGADEVPFLIRELKYPASSIAAARLLGGIGPDARLALSALFSDLGVSILSIRPEKNGEYTNSTARAIEQIEPGALGRWRVWVSVWVCLIAGSVAALFVGSVLWLGGTLSRPVRSPASAPPPPSDFQDENPLRFTP
jgi:hypothetical protein